ncbi:MAG: pyridoxal phosphate-dependent aminotransferase [Candidatus Eisenbacteria bacterium]|nr:pyridoxal phosphate-dependent aminotransferase [Candidatus Eisenbacteria bacterium]
MRPVKLSARGAEAPPSPIRKLVPLADAARGRGRKVHSLNIGQPDIRTPEVMWEALRRDLPEVLAYSHSAGIVPLREGLSRYYARHRVDFGPDELLVTAGGSEAILFALAAVTDPGDEILIPEPLYANYLGFARMLEITVVPIPTTAEEGYHLPPRAIWEERLSSRTRAILFSNPGNPTGTVYEAQEIEMVLGLAASWGLFIIADEVYREFCYDGRDHESVVACAAHSGKSGELDRVILVDSISKRFSACGARIGCLGTKNQDVLRSALAWAQARLSPPSLGQIMATAAVELPASYYEQIRVEYERRRDAVMQELETIPGVLCRKPRGAFYVMATLPVADAEEFARWMLESFEYENETTFVAPGNGFYATPAAGQHEVRIAYVFEEERLRRAIQVLARGLETFRRA